MSLENWNDLLNLSAMLSEIKLSEFDDDLDLKHNKMPYSFRSSFCVNYISCLISHSLEELDLKKSLFYHFCNYLPKLKRKKIVKVCLPY